MLASLAAPCRWNCWLRVFTIFDALIFTLFEFQFPFQFPRAVGEDGKRIWEVDGLGAGFMPATAIKCW